MLHGSFANTSARRRATLIWGYLPHVPALAKFTEEELRHASEQIQAAANYHHYLYGHGSDSSSGTGPAVDVDGAPRRFVHTPARARGDKAAQQGWEGWERCLEVLDRQPPMRPF